MRITASTTTAAPSPAAAMIHALLDLLLNLLATTLSKRATLPAALERRPASHRAP